MPMLIDAGKQLLIDADVGRVVLRVIWLRHESFS
jgi:hypothetical protein